MQNDRLLGKAVGANAIWTMAANLDRTIQTPNL